MQSWLQKSNSVGNIIHNLIWFTMYWWFYVGHMRRYIGEIQCTVAFQKQYTNWDDTFFPWCRSWGCLCCLKSKQDTCGVRRSCLCEYVFGFFNIFVLIYIPDIADIKWFNSNVLHKPPYVGHAGYQKMIRDLRKQLFNLAKNWR